MISSFQNFSSLMYNPPAAFNHVGGGHVGQQQQQQLHSVYNAVAAAQHGVYNGGQQPVPYHPADYGAQPQLPQPSAYTAPSRYYETPRPAAVAPEPAASRKKSSQQPPVQYTRVQSGVPGGKTIRDEAGAQT